MIEELSIMEQRVDLTIADAATLLTPEQIEMALAEAAPSETILVLEEIDRQIGQASVDPQKQRTIDTNGAQFGVDYGGDPDLPTSWFALTPRDVNVDIRLTTFVTQPVTEVRRSIFFTAPVPEPSSVGLLAGASLAGLLRRRRKLALHRQ